VKFDETSICADIDVSKKDNKLAPWRVLITQDESSDNYLQDESRFIWYMSGFYSGFNVTASG
jgi:hypothetical protein